MRTGLKSSKKIKVVRIIARLNIGGPAIHTILLTAGLNKDIFDTYFIAGKPEASEGEMLGLAESKGVNVHFISSMRREIGLKDIPAFFSILRTLWKVRPDIVHTHTAKAGTLGRAAAFVAGVPVKIHTFHGHVFDGYFSPAKAGLFIAIEKALAKVTDRIITVSDSVRDQVVKTLKLKPESKCVVIKLGLDLKNFLDNEGSRGRFRKEYNVGADTIVVGIVGRLVPIKNHAMFLAACRRVIDRMPDHDIKFFIIGDGELRQHLEKEALRLGLEKHVIFTGWIRDVAVVYADLDIAALTSLNEGTPVSLIEAMASGRPVIATSVGGVPDIVSDGKNGVLVRTDDADGFADGLVSIIKDPDRRKSMGLRGKEFVRNTFHKDRLIKDMEELYVECLKEKQKS